MPKHIVPTSANLHRIQRNVTCVNFDVFGSLLPRILYRFIAEFLRK